jgi:hypothetical protein
MVHFSKIFFSKNSKNLCHFSKNSKKFQKKFASQMSVSNGVLTLKKAVLIINSFYVTNSDRLLNIKNLLNSVMNCKVLSFFYTIFFVRQVHN